MGATNQAVDLCWDGRESPSMGGYPRDEVRRRVFERDNYECVFCQESAQDAHHLLERRLWNDGGYHEDNLISVCGPCHWKCEQTLITVEEGRKAAGITNVLVPDHFYEDQAYDKWGNPIMSNGRRLRGELFEHPSVQQVLREADILSLFSPYVKYPRTYHLPWSHPNRNDKTLRSLKEFEGKEIVITEKMDGECTTLYNDYLHARSLDGPSHPSQGWVRNFHSKIAHDIPNNFRVCGENVYARHSIKYEELETYFYGFSVWSGLTCLSWDETIEWFELLDVTPVPMFYRGPFEEFTHTHNGVSEGYVIRLVDSFSYIQFKNCVGKYVRPNHLQTPERWDGRFERNTLKRT